jgi:Kunitz/Bovine pancreatic trypsin inhibitor domain
MIFAKLLLKKFVFRQPHSSMFGSKLFAFCLLIAYLGQTLGSLPAKCLLPKVVGHCEAAMPRFYFNSATNACEKFIYGGCGANENNFKSQEQCVADCECEYNHLTIRLVYLDKFDVSNS